MKILSSVALSVIEGWDGWLAFVFRDVQARIGRPPFPFPINLHQYLFSVPGRAHHTFKYQTSELGVGVEIRDESIMKKHFPVWLY